MDIKEINEKIQRESAFVDLLTMELSKVIVGQKYMVERLLIGRQACLVRTSRRNLQQHR